MAPPLPTRKLGTDIVLTTLLLTGLTAVLGAAAARWLELGTDFQWRAVIGFAVVATIVGWLARKSPELHSFGAANRITMLRVALIALIAACIGEARTDLLSWTIVVVVTVTLFIDGMDGRVARRTNSSSAFGARFDMETDAALIMILAVLCWQFGKAGIWILAAGALRYAFVLAALPLRWMRAPLPYSRRRQTVCIVQSGCLLGVISPVFPVPASEILAAGTLVMLGTSFAIDVRWLWTAHAHLCAERRRNLEVPAG